MPDSVETIASPEVEARTYSLTIAATITVPANAKEIEAFDGRIIGFLLPDGSQVKPNIVLEHMPATGDDSKDPSYEEVSALGFDVGIDETREFV